MTGLGIDEVFSSTDSAGARYFLTDGLGSTLALTDGAGVVQTSYGYEPYGNTTAGGAASTNSFQYTGRENDGTGLYYYRARYYSPSYQRFVSEDPLGLAAGPNLYAYVGGNPISRRDPNGQFWTTLIGIAAGGYAGYVSGGNWQSATIGAIAGGVVGTLAPVAAAAAGTAAGEVGSFANLFAAGAAYLVTGGVVGATATADINVANGKPAGEGIGYGAAAGILVPMASGEAALVAARELAGVGNIAEAIFGTVGAGFGIIASYMDPGAAKSWKPRSEAPNSQSCK